MFEKEKEYNLKKLTQEYETDLKEKQSNIEALLKELKSLKQIPISTYADLKQKQQKLETPIENQTHIDFHIGEEVYIPTYDQYGVIKQIKKDKYFVQVGYFELEFVKSSLQKHISKEKPIKKSSTKKSPKVSHTSKPSGQYVFELDLRGYRYNDVKPALDQAIDQAILTNQASLRIIHGYGTGAVKKAVYDIIKNHPEIKSHRYGQEGEGLTGATIIFFK
ncbi:MAG: Smr/MutS family protein [Acholeplasmataceae bacterium]